MSGAEKMRRIIMLGALLLAGCTGIKGPRQVAADPTPIDPPWLSIAQQEKRGRDLLALPDNTTVLPRDGNDAALRPGPQGR
jgi:hypothetical protein